MNIKQHPDIETKFNSYPDHIKEKLLNLRSLIIQCAEESELEEIEETLKWGEPSYIAKKGSTIRIDWKEKKSPDTYAIYFKCTSKLVPTFKKRFPDTFNYETTRAIHFGFDDPIPVKELKTCIHLALHYHTVKNSL